MRTKPTVFVVDSDAENRAAVRALVDQMDVRCEEYDSGQKFLESYDLSEPGCVVVEVRIPDVGGLQIQSRLAQQEATLPVIFLTAHADAPTAVRAMRSGALHFLEKPFREHELWEAIQEAIVWNQELRQERIQREKRQDLLARLTPKERQVLEKIVEGKPNRLISEELGVCVRTVELRRASLMGKLQVESLTELLQLVGTGSCGALGNNGRKRGDGVGFSLGQIRTRMALHGQNDNGHKRLPR